MTLISDKEHITAIELAHFDMTGHGSSTLMIAKRGYSNVPAKLLTFLPDGYNKKKPSNEDPDCKEPHVVCHPCTWESSKVSSIAKKWNLVKGSAKQNNGIPYDIVPLSAVMGHCLVIPDLVLPDVIYVISEKGEWHEHF